MQKASPSTNASATSDMNSTEPSMNLRFSRLCSPSPSSPSVSSAPVRAASMAAIAESADSESNVSESPFITTSLESFAVGASACPVSGNASSAVSKVKNIILFIPS